MGHFSEAESELREAIDLHPRSFVRGSLAKALIGQGKLLEARLLLENELAKLEIQDLPNPNHTWAYRKETSPPRQISVGPARPGPMMFGSWNWDDGS